MVYLYHRRAHIHVQLLPSNPCPCHFTSEGNWIAELTLPDTRRAPLIFIETWAINTEIAFDLWCVRLQQFTSESDRHYSYFAAIISVGCEGPRSLILYIFHFIIWQKCIYSWISYCCGVRSHYYKNIIFFFYYLIFFGHFPIPHST